MAYTVSDVGNMLGVNDETVRRWIREGKIQAKRNMGRGGNSIRLEDVVAFANQPPKSFLGNLVAWLDEHDIAYEKVTESSDGSSSKIEKEDVLSALPLAVVNPVLGAAAMTIAKGRRKKANPSYKVQLLLPSKESTAVMNEEELIFEENQDTAPLAAQAEMFEEGSNPSSNNDSSDIGAMIRDEQMKLIRLRQELAQIQAKIAVAEGQIEYYNLLRKK